MPINKNALIRYHALDKCFSNFGRTYYIEDLIEACNEALYEFSGIEEGVKRRQIFDDINFMESPEGWEIPLDRIKDGRRVFYRYYEQDFSIKKQPVNELEAIQINNALLVLERFKGIPQFEWIEEIKVRLNSIFKIDSKKDNIVEFENNPYLKGLNFFQYLFNCIYYGKVVEIVYRPFMRENNLTFIVSPYFLKQYNSRWFLFAYNHEFENITNIPLDRIESIKELKVDFITNDNFFDAFEFFEDIVGVTNVPNSTTERIVLKIDKSRWDYIETKPIHGSQKVLERNEEFVKIELELKINKEFLSLIFSFGPEIKVLSPISLVNIIKERAFNTLSNYE